MTTTEHLTTGWEADLAHDDTLVRRYLHHWAAATAAFAEAAGGRSIRTARFAAADYGRPSGYFNATTLLAPLPHPHGDDDTRWESVLDEIERFHADGTGSYELWSIWPTPDLRPRGWKLEGHPPLLCRPPAAMVPPPERPDLDVRAVSDERTLEDWERVAVTGYPLAELEPFHPRTLADRRLLEDPRIQAWVGYLQGKPVSIGTLFAEDDLASLSLGVTLPEARRLGFWRRHAVDRLLAVPDLWVTGVFSDFSRPGAQELGFVPIDRFTLWTRTR